MRKKARRRKLTDELANMTPQMRRGKDEAADVCRPVPLIIADCTRGYAGGVQISR
jgi:hypothetical protein